MVKSWWNRYVIVSITVFIFTPLPSLFKLYDPLECCQISDLGSRTWVFFMSHINAYLVVGWFYTLRVQRREQSTLLERPTEQAYVGYVMLSDTEG
ncbi:hypothetical protein Pdw03_3731 [Penicillium digitatum]|uniref:Uncharacterized protein n=1 Tax=Penicillium digitatum TaxID=36651 RepID=A0A7T6XGW8_PENDI|nr:hypothetical protein Pdw03_3731 [Penicillium digitatum]